MEDILDISEKIKQRLIEKFNEQKTDLFNSNGTIYGRSWPDLTEKYKDWKQNEIGRIYPMNILYGELLTDLLDNALKIDIDYNDSQVIFKLTVDTDRMKAAYSNRRNEDREYIRFSDEEKNELVNICQQTIQEYFGII